MPIIDIEARRNFPQHETYNLPNGILLLPLGLEGDFLTKFQSALIKKLGSSNPKKLGKVLGFSTRAEDGFVRKLDIEGTPVVLKKTRQTLKEMREAFATYSERSAYANLVRFRGSYFPQLNHVYNIPEKYGNLYPDDPISIEEPVGVFCRNISDRRDVFDREYWVIYKYYDGPGFFSQDAESDAYKAEEARMERQCERLRKMRYADIQYIISGTSESGYKGVIIDTK